MSQELELEALTKKIFSTEPQKKFSIQIKFDTSNIKELFESLLMIVTQGMKQLFGDSQGKVNLIQISTEEFKYFNQYLHSFGMEMLVEIETYQFSKSYEQMKYHNYPVTPKTELSELKFPILQDNGSVFIISFDFYRDYS